MSVESTRPAWHALSDGDLLEIQSTYAALARELPLGDERAYYRGVSRAARLELHERQVLGRPKLPYTFRCAGREATVSCHDGIYRVVYGDAAEIGCTWRATEAEAFVAARGWAFEGVLPRSQTTLRGLQPIELEGAV